MAETWGETPAVAARLHELIAAVRASPHNLLSPRGLEELPSRHVPECLALARRLPDGPARLLDVGSGGGFPGLVIAIVRDDLEVALVEATTKKARFLTETAATLEVPVEVVNARAEDLLPDLAGRFDLVTARAVAPLPRLLDWTLPFLRPGGTLHAVKGQRWSEELEAAAPALRRLGGRVVSVPEGRGDDPWDPRVVTIAGPGWTNEGGRG